jgi:hypothetical protein
MAAGGVIRSLDDLERDARELVVFADGIEENGFRRLAQRSRCAADDILQLVTELRAERSVRMAIQEQRDAFERLAARYAAGREKAAA